MRTYDGYLPTLNHHRAIARRSTYATVAVAVLGPRYVAIAADSLEVGAHGQMIRGRKTVTSPGHIGAISGFTRHGDFNFVDQLKMSLANPGSVEDAVDEFVGRIETNAHLALQSLRHHAGAPIDSINLGLLIADKRGQEPRLFVISIDVGDGPLRPSGESPLSFTGQSVCAVIGIKSAADPFGDRSQQKTPDRSSILPIFATLGEHEEAATALVQRAIDAHDSSPAPSWWPPGAPLVDGPPTVVSL